MAYKAKAYTLREESTESGIRYFISFKDGQGEHHELEVSEQLFFEFRQMERRNRNLLQWDSRFERSHRLLAFLLPNILLTYSDSTFIVLR